MTKQQALQEFKKWLKTKAQENTVISYMCNIKKFLEWIEIEKLEKIKLETVLEYLNYLKKQDYADQTIKVKTEAIRQFIDYFVEKDQLHINTDLINTPDNIESNSYTPVSEEDLEKMLVNIEQSQKRQVLKLRDKTILCFLYCTGVRTSELTNLKEHQVCLEKQKAKINTKKSNQKRIIMWNDRTNKLLKDYLHFKQETDNKHLFVQHASREYSGEPPRLFDRAL